MHGGIIILSHSLYYLCASVKNGINKISKKFRQQGFSILALIICLLSNAEINAQDFLKNLNDWSEKNKIEKIYVHTDRKVYFAGQTLWLKSYFLSDFKPSTDNSTLFIELLNNNSEIIAKKVLPVFDAITYGQIEIPDSLSTGTYWLCAYSPLMLNQNKAYLFKTSVKVFGKKTKSNNTINTSEDQIAIRFYPEGGNLIAGVQNKVAFKVFSNNTSANTTGKVIDENGREILSFSTLHDGMGSFYFTPIAGKNYKAFLNAENKTFNFPSTETDGVAIDVIQQDNFINYSLTCGSNNELFKPKYCIIQMQNKVVFKEEISNSDGKKFSGIISDKNFRSGIAQLTFFNKDDKPLAERLLFIDNKEYSLPVTFHEEKIEAAARKLNAFSINLPDNTEGNFSVSVTDADYDESGYRSENLVSAILLTDDLPSYVNNPSWYLGNDSNAKSALDLLMLTNGWRRFNWTDVTKNTLPKPLYSDPGYISLSGNAHIRGSTKNFADRDLLVWTQAAGSGPHVQMVKTNERGDFTLDSVVFFDKAKILFSDVMGNKSKFLTIKLNTDSLYKKFDLPTWRNHKANFTPATNLSSKMQSAYFDYSRREGLLMDNVEIEGRKLTDDELEKKYMTGLFSGGINARTINLTGQFIPQWNVFDWLVGRVPSLRIDRIGNLADNYRLFFRQQPVQLFLDEIPLTDATLISTIPANQIALVKIFPQFIGARGNNAAIAFYTKKYDDIAEDIETSGDIIDYDGYSIIKEYYSPDYAQPIETNYKDYRLTLHWQPEILVKGNNKIPIRFYNNDRTKRFRIVVEGVTKDGKLFTFEKTVAAGK